MPDSNYSKNITQLFNYHRQLKATKHASHKSPWNRPISQAVFMLSIAVTTAEHVCATVIIKHNFH